MSTDSDERAAPPARPRPTERSGSAEPARDGDRPRRRGAAHHSAMNGSGPAGIVSRALAAVLDVIMAVVLCGVLVLGSALIDVVLDPRSLAWPLRLPWGVSAASFGVVAAVYLAFCWGTGGRTVGAALMGTRLVSGRSRPGWVTAVLRAGLCVIFPIGLLWVVVDRDRRSLQDRVLGTAVVYDEPAVVRRDGDRDRNCDGDREKGRDRD